MNARVLQAKTQSKNRLVLRLAENQMEIEKTLALRYKVFNEEMGEGLPESVLSGKDRDKFDLYCDHLIVVDETNDNTIVGTYRILNGKKALTHSGFYSAGEFKLDNIYAVADQTAELGRSCVHPDYRDGSVIQLLWKGLAWYLNQNNIRYLIGCGSIHSTDPVIASTTYAYFREKKAFADPALRVEPLKAHRMKGFDPDCKINNLREAGMLVPPLIKGYLRAGAKISGEPALDEVFGVTDFFIVFDTLDINKRYSKKYEVSH